MLRQISHTGSMMFPVTCRFQPAVTGRIAAARRGTLPGFMTETAVKITEEGTIFQEKGAKRLRWEERRVFSARTHSP